jgi:hypothetical protein
MPAFQGNYVTQEFLDDEDGHLYFNGWEGTWLGSNDLGATRPGPGGLHVGDHVWSFGGEWTTGNIYHIEVTQEEVDEIDKVGQVDNFEERRVEIPVPTLSAAARLSLGISDAEGTYYADQKVAGDAAAKSPDESDADADAAAVGAPPTLSLSLSVNSVLCS